jgi:hypothetical protein
MKQNSVERLAAVFSNLLNRIHDYCSIHSEKGQPFGACTANPKHAAIPIPTPEIQSELERRATEYFQSTQAVGYYFRYWTPPMLPEIRNDRFQEPVTADDYNLVLEVPQFDDKWQQITIARSLIYCPLDQEQHGWSDWFELQLEAIRLTPLLHQTLNELKAKSLIKMQLSLPGKPIFESFVYEYAVHDTNFSTMNKQEIQLWKERKMDWKARYRLAAEVINSATTLRDLYSVARKKAASSRNPMLKSLFWKFVEHIEQKLVGESILPDDQKQSIILLLRQVKKRESKGKYQAKRPALCISDVECGQILYLLMQEFLKGTEKSYAVAEAIIFIWISQHAAFSGQQIKVEDILSIRIKDIDHNNLTIQIKKREADITGGLNEVLIAWLGESKRPNKRFLFQNLTYDVLEDIIAKSSEKFHGTEGKLCPRDFLEKVHVIPGARIPLKIRRQITEQEEVVMSSPYRIDARLIQKQIKESIQKRQAQKAF